MDRTPTNFSQLEFTLVTQPDPCSGLQDIQLDYYGQLLRGTWDQHQAYWNNNTQCFDVIDEIRFRLMSCLLPSEQMSAKARVIRWASLYFLVWLTGKSDRWATSTRSDCVGHVREASGSPFANVMESMLYQKWAHLFVMPHGKCVHMEAVGSSKMSRSISPIPNKRGDHPSSQCPNVFGRCPVAG